MRNSESITPVEMLAELVRFDSSSAKGNQAMVEFIADYLTQCQIDCDVVHDSVEKQSNLLAQLGGDKHAQGILLVGHSDVVDATEPGWLTDPFQLKEQGKQLVARGVCDMKGFLATVLSMAPNLHARDGGVPVHLGITFNGESDFLGAKRLAYEIEKNKIKPISTILGKPSSMQVVMQHKGLTRIVTEVRTPGGHSAARHRNANAVWIASHLIDYLEKLDQQSRHMPDPEFNVDPAWTTINVASVFGGTKSNTVPGCCTFEWEIRDVTTFSASEVLTQFTRYCEATINELEAGYDDIDQQHIQIESVQEYRAEPFIEKELSRCHLLALESSETSGNDPDAVKGASANHTEASVYNEAGLDVVVCGPGSIADAHKANECIDVRELEQCQNFLHNVIARADADTNADAVKAAEDDGTIAA